MDGLPRSGLDVRHCLTSAEGAATRDLAARGATTLSLLHPVAQGVANEDGTVRAGGTAPVAAFSRARGAGLSGGEHAEGDEDAVEIHCCWICVWWKAFRVVVLVNEKDCS